jgi:hypothetical protein
MAELVSILLSFPTVIFTVMLAITVLYWLFVVLGAIDLDFLGGGADAAVDGALDGALEGAVKGAAEGALKGIAEGAAKGVAEGAADAAGEGHLAELFSALNLRKAPVTVVLTLFAAFGWLASAMTIQALGPAWAGFFAGTGVLFGSGLVSLLATSLAVRPLGKLFVTHSAKGARDLVGQTCIISTGEVGPTYGQATLEDGGAGLILQVRCDDRGRLKRGDRALIIGWDADDEGFSVEPLDAMLDSERPRRIPVARAAAPVEIDAPEEPAEADSRAAGKTADRS